MQKYKKRYFAGLLFALAIALSFLIPGFSSAAASRYSTLNKVEIPLKVSEDFIPLGRANRPGHSMIPNYITIHDTANTSSTATAKMHASYIKSDACANRPASWHFTVDCIEAFQHLPLNENGWHCGDGVNGTGNRQSIGIEICENSGGNRAKAESNAAWLTAKLLIELDIPLSGVKQHNNWNGANCPRVLRGRSGGWQSFLADVEQKKNFLLNTPVITSITADPESPQVAGSIIQWTCLVEEEDSDLQYRFQVYRGKTLIFSGSYSSSNTFSWQPDKVGDSYRIRVYVRNPLKQTANAWSEYYSVTKPPPPVITSLTADIESPQEVGAVIQWSCEAEGEALQYRFQVYRGKTLVNKGSYSSSSTFNWQPDKAGEYRVRVYVRNIVKDTVESWSDYYTLENPPPPVITSLTADIESPQEVGAVIRWSCEAEGEALQYHFQVYRGKTLVHKGSYSSSGTFNWQPTGAGEYRVRVYVRNFVKATVQSWSDYYIIQNPPPPVITSLTADIESPQEVGAVIRWSCEAEGDALQYRFYLYSGSTLIYQGSYSSSSSFNWQPTKAGQYRVRVYVRNLNKDTVESWSDYYSIVKPPPPVITSLNADKESPQAAGTTIQWICEAEGADLQYRFRVYKGATEEYSGSYGSSNTFNWKPTNVGDSYRIRVYVKNKAGDVVDRWSGYYIIGTPILGSPHASLGQAQAWAKARGAHERFIGIAPVYWQYGLITGIRPEILYAQSAKETNFGKYTGIVQPEQNNWAGIKISSPTGELAQDHESFPTPEDGVRGHFNHISAYVGLAPVGTPHGRYYVVKNLSWAGTIRYVEELSGKWAPSPDYGASIVNHYLNPLLATER